ncbi:BppU family phage baseplate upper protein [Halobellus limi]|uniref:DUF2479 domain-containing protein n=1 Tax=Halobellus limi TaxID=699433 RepID=A0A1H5ZH29_9EURY|nr:BppU family phage baseplate upper protein [Halobellus limi]QCC48100.1 DUF2479 domain-containing protein [Halobellus limi]SEG35552.1 hypothetical protein SAMN04488133_1994 [Halobellus limi]
MVDYKITQNDRYPALVGFCRDEDGAAVDLTDATVEFHMKARGSDAVKVNESASILDATAGKVAYQWRAGDTDTAGVFLAEFEVTYSDGFPETFPSEPLEIFIRPELG